MPSKVSKITKLDQPLQKIMIIGAGPVGLATLSYLIEKMDVKADHIIIVDHRIEDYTRSGDVIPSVFAIFSDLLKYNVTPSQGYHIKDIERTIYQHAQSIPGVQFIKAKFIAFSANRTAILSNGTNIPVDVVLDCSGTSRLGIEAINSHLENPYFKMKSTSDDNQTQSNLLIRLLMNENDHEEYSLKKSNMKFYPTPSQYRLLKFFEMRAMGWDSYALPLFYGNCPNRIPDEHNKLKVSFYLEAPNNLNSTEQIRWTKLCLEFALEKEYHLDLHAAPKKTTTQNKKNISYFKINTAMAHPFYYAGSDNLPLLIHMGDATANTHYRFGAGMRYAIARMKVLFNALEIADGEIKNIKLAQYEYGIQDALFQQLVQLQYMSTDYKNDKKEAAERMTALTLASYEACIKSYNRIKHAEKGLQFNNIFTSPLEPLQECIMTAKILKEAHSVDSLVEKINAFMVELAGCCRKVGKHFVTLNNTKLALKYFKMSVELYRTYFPGQYVNELIALYSNLIVMQKNCPAEVLSLSDIAMSQFAEVTLDAAEKNKFIGKILNFRILTLLQQCEDLLKSPELRQDELLVMFGKIESVLPEYINNAFVQASGVVNYEQRLAACKEKLVAKSEQHDKVVINSIVPQESLSLDGSKRLLR